MIRICTQELAALGQMAAGIAHEIRNPLGSIKLYASMLDEDLRTMPAQQDIAQKIGRAVTGLDSIVSDVLDFAREWSPSTPCPTSEGNPSGWLSCPWSCCS